MTTFTFLYEVRHHDGFIRIIAEMPMFILLFCWGRPNESIIDILIDRNYLYYLFRVYYFAW